MGNNALEIGRAAECPAAFVGVPLLRAVEISKSFGRQQALKGVSLEAYAGEIHFVMGENGAGKSTLMNILGGVLRPEAGIIQVDGNPVSFSSPASAQAAGIAVIHQELALVPHLSVAQNVMLGRELTGAIPGVISRQRELAAARAVLRQLGFAGDLDAPVHRLSTGKQQIVEIAKALSQNARILIMDEPTASISEADCQHLYGIMNDLKQNNVAIIYISHRMKELTKLADRVTVLRDGERIASSMLTETSEEEIIHRMIGRNATTFFRRKSYYEPGETLVKLEKLETATGLKNISLEVRRREIVGLAGLVGSGRSEVARAIFGADKITFGSITIKGDNRRPSPVTSVRRGVAFVPEDRKGEGIAVDRSIMENLVLPSLWRLFPAGVIFKNRYSKLVNDVFAQLRIAARGPAQLARKLSGGNQQKVVLGKWLPLDCDLYIIDEPTRGIDIGAKAEIFHILENLAASGRGVLLISSELPEIVGACDRVYVMRDGTIAGSLSKEAISEAAIMRLTIA